jgi:hypothetical protein
MPKYKSALDEKAEFIASLIGDNFLRLAWALRELQDTQPDIFLKVVDLVGLSPRKAYALTRIARQFDNVAEERLHFIGWSKLTIIGRYLTENNIEYLLQLAEENTSYDLQVRLRGETPIEGAKVVQLYLAPDNHKRLKTALMKHGAVASGNGLAKMESALMALVDKMEPGA